MREQSEEWVQAENTRALRKDTPSNKDWPTFSGEGEYNHIEWIDWVDQTVAEFEIPDKLVTAKLSIVLKGLARNWYVEKRKDQGKMSWAEVKEAMKKRFGTNIWRNKMEETYLHDNFKKSSNIDCLTWALNQKKRIRAFQEDCSQSKSLRKYCSEWIMM